MGWLKDMVVGAATAAGDVVPELLDANPVIGFVAAPLAGAVVGGLWTGITTGSVSAGLKAGAVDGLGALGGWGIGKAMTKTAARHAGQAAARTVGRATLQSINRALNGRGRRIVFSALGSAAASQLTPDARPSNKSQPDVSSHNDISNNELPARLPTRPAGVQYRGANSAAAIPMKLSRVDSLSGTVSS
ncbi:hypothetical protein [Nocardia sp. CDC160]|uniref:hypothetical protein n=1 Tax=Nocardia sp. CDC160 TaxID=3112166 RepID=UPI002DB88E95|nr:hypothetical protein [Nocardia sp. CDC160]MEC3920198.1 hypothetical protein [Nocardia sp. CDC160]